MKGLVVAVSTALVLTTPLAGQNTDDNEPPPWLDANRKIAEHCRAEWADDYAMQEYCRDTAREAANKIVLMLRNRGGVPIEVMSRIVAKCFSEWSPWPDGDGQQSTYDYSMIHYCMDRQVGAYKRLNPPREQLPR